MKKTEQLDQLDKFTKSLPACLLQDILADQFGNIARAIQSDYCFIQMEKYEDDWNQTQQMLQSDHIELALMKNKIKESEDELARLESMLKDSRRQIEALRHSLTLSL